VDSTTQALTWMSAYNGAEQWLQAMDEVDRRRNERDYGVQHPESYTVSFRHVEPNAEIKLSNGRWIFCAADGLYHVTPTEWQNAMQTPGLTLVHHPDH
jgi:hypothetical protein